jgi:hypothetical protein
MRNRVLLSAAIFLSSLLTTYAALPDTKLDVKAEKKIITADRSHGIDTDASSERWTYVITLRNTSFKDIPEARVEYKVIVRGENNEAIRNRITSKRIAGGKDFGLFEKNAQVSLETDKIELEKTKLAYGWISSSNNRTLTKDSIEGILIRVTSQGNVVYSTAIPETLGVKEVWDDPNKDKPAGKKK